MLPAEERGVVYEPLDERNWRAAAALAVEHFPAQQELTRALGVTSDDMRDYLTAYFRECAGGGLSVVARLAEGPAGGRLVGTALGVDFHAPAPAAAVERGRGMAVLSELRADLREWYSSALPRMRGVVFYCKLGVVAPGAASRGVGRRMAELIVGLAAARGFVMATARATGEASRHFFRDHLGFRELRSIAYKGYRDAGGRQPLRGIDEREAKEYVVLAKSLQRGLWVGRPPATAGEEGWVGVGVSGSCSGSCGGESGVGGASGVGGGAKYASRL